MPHMSPAHQAMRMVELCGPDGLKPATVPIPQVGPNGVRIRVVVAGVSFPDALMARGLYQDSPDLPFTPGFEVAGVVEEAPDHSGLAAGDRVGAFLPTAGGFAEVALAQPEYVFKLPEAVTFETAAAATVNYQTAYFALATRGRLRAGETMLIHGAGGGTGTAAIQVGAALGARVIAVVGNDAKRRVATEAGAEHVVTLDTDWAGAVKELTGGHGVELAFDPVGGERFDETLRLLRPEGRVLIIGFAGGEVQRVAAHRLLLRNVDAVGVAWGARLKQEPWLARQVADAVIGLLVANKVRPIIGGRYSLTAAPAALRALEQRRATGKLVLNVGGANA